MKSVDLNTWQYKGYQVQKFEHPELIGRYEIYDKEFLFVKRCYTLKEAKIIISDHNKHKHKK